MNDHFEARFAAVGGQGILLAGDIIAEAAISFEGKYAVDSPTYTAQVRGGPTKVDVIIDSKRIEFTRTTAIDFMLCLSQNSWNRFGFDLKENCIVLIDPSLVFEVDEERYRVYRLPIIEITKKGLKKMVYTSAVSLGAMAGLTSYLKPDSIKKALLKKAPRGTEEPNMKAFDLGFEAVRELMK
ncbi:MAG: 2-oxoacid:acceptor oxidoreductase family protein [Candidatus Hatepunaea meridiana]|nr:2-oxoacid:acceptor oxidoreductase family protein [Candidatus Hatepunaea meridiana]